LTQFCDIILVSFIKGNEVSKIAHIFNEVHRDNNKPLFFEETCFDIDYIENIINGNLDKSINCDSLNEEARFSLKPIQNKSIIDKYDEEKIKSVIEELDDKLLLISGDFWGIQNFIFNNLASKYAAKIIRARSAMVQLITKMISNELMGDDIKEVLFGAGKFLLVGNNNQKVKEKIEKIKQKINEWFIKNYFGLAGFVISYVFVNKEDLENQNENIKKSLKVLANENEKAKLNKFKDIFKDENKVVIKVFDEENIELCEFCKMRMGNSEIKVNEESKKVCDICENEIKLGRILALNNYNFLSFSKYGKGDVKKIKVLDKEVYFYKNEGEYDISNNKMKKQPKWPLKSYVPLKGDNIKTFEEIEDNKSGLMALKADIDGLGDTFRKFYFDSFKKFNRLSREVNFFFANYTPYLIKNHYPNLYVVFAGGDDLFVVGPYDEIVEFAIDIRDKFVTFALEKATLSMGLVMFKSSTPIHFVAEWCEEAEKRAKKYDGKDAIDIFGVTMKFDEFKEIKQKVEAIIKEVSPSKSMLYKVINLIKMANEVEKDFTKTEWISKFFYYTNRNIKSKKEKFLEFVPLIEKYKIKVLPSIYLQIYRLRDIKEEK